jgi:hypothetical protein
VYTQNSNGKYLGKLKLAINKRHGIVATGFFKREVSCNERWANAGSQDGCLTAFARQNN